MTNGFPCPNPTCTHVFPAGEVEGASSLHCPRCGYVFQFRSVPVAKPVATMPPAKQLPKPAAIPVAVPVRPPPPQTVRPAQERGVAVGIPRSPAPIASPVSDALVAPAALIGPRRPSTRNRVYLAIAVVIGLGAVSPAIYFAITHGLNRPEEVTDPGPPGSVDGMVRNVNNKTELAFRLMLPPEVWKPALTLKQNLGATVAVERGGPHVWLAIAVKDYDQRKPRAAELLTEAIERLTGHFGERVAFGMRAEASELAGQRAQRLEFKGTHNAVVWRGECHMMTHHGLGYWLFIAASELATAQRALADLQKEPVRGFVLATARKGWTEQPPELDSFRADPFFFDVKAPKGVWLGGFDARQVDNRGVLYLVGRDLSEKDPLVKNIKNAEVLVTAQDQMGDSDAAMKAARAALDDKLTQKGERYKLGFADEKPPADSELGTKSKIGSTDGRVVELCLFENSEAKRFLLLAVVPLSNRVLVFHCECRWDYRQAWRSDFLELLSTLRVHAK